MFSLTKSRVAAGAVGIAGAGLALVLTLGHAGAQTPPAASATPTAKASPSPAAKSQRVKPTDTFLADLAGKLNVSVDQLKSAITGAEKDTVNAEVTNGKLTQDQANKIIARIDKGGPATLPRILAAHHKAHHQNQTK